MDRDVSEKTYTKFKIAPNDPEYGDDCYLGRYCYFVTRRAQKSLGFVGSGGSMAIDATRSFPNRGLLCGW